MVMEAGFAADCQGSGRPRAIRDFRINCDYSYIFLMFSKPIW